MTSGIRDTAVRAVALLIVLLIVLLAAPAPALAGEWALVVGIDRYDGSDIVPLKCPRTDARAVAQALIKSCGYRSDHVILVTSDATEPREKPTSANILRWLYGLRKSIKPGDTFVFYFSGHGMVSDGESFLLTSDSALGTGALLKKTSLSVKEVHDALKEVRARCVLQLIDACRNDPRSGRATGDNKMSGSFSRDLAVKAHDREGLPDVDVAATIFACRTGQRSYENCEGHGYFTYFLLQGLYGGAAGPSGEVTLSSLVTYLQQKVPDAVRLREQGRVQEPWAEVSGTGALDWVLARVRAEAAPGRETQSAALDASQPTVTLRVPSGGVKTPAATFTVPAVVAGGRPQKVTVAVNGRPVVVPAGAVSYTSSGAAMNLEIPLEMGENSVVVTAVSPAGVPAQSVAMVIRDPSAPVPIAAAPLPAVPTEGRVTAQSAAAYYTGELPRVRSQYDRDREKWGRDEADIMRPTTTIDRDK